MVINLGVAEDMSQAPADQNPSGVRAAQPEQVRFASFLTYNGAEVGPPCFVKTLVLARRLCNTCWLTTICLQHWSCWSRLKKLEMRRTLTLYNTSSVIKQSFLPKSLQNSIPTTVHDPIQDVHTQYA